MGKQENVLPKIGQEKKYFAQNPPLQDQMDRPQELFLW